ncbi:MAG TPA: hypothetical protein VI793_06090, partial [Anaerolineales bacterium]|nr:hypothetical protein [Anaerolineales bacterium]
LGLLGILRTFAEFRQYHKSEDDVIFVTASQPEKRDGCTLEGGGRAPHLAQHGRQRHREAAP